MSSVHVISVSEALDLSDTIGNEDVRVLGVE